MKNLASLDARSVLKRFGLHADKRLGQNFLQDSSALEAIVHAAEIEPADTVLEIGPGLGSLTRYLAVSAKTVVAVELDERLIPPLGAILTPYSNTRIVHGNILDLHADELVGSDEYIVVANIPYYITSVVIRHLLESTIKPRRIVLTIQKEVAERICAEPGGMSLLALSVQVYGEPHIAAKIPPDAFFPAPKVESAVLVVDIFDQPLIGPEFLELFFKLIKAGFSQKRKTLRNSLSAGLPMPPSEAEDLLKKAGIDPQRRAETLSIEEWDRLCRNKKTGDL
jgi:16S rRNA (adenine1518-N6/adenine1519-N6)-dimethyltransferase